MRNNGPAKSSWLWNKPAQPLQEIVPGGHPGAQAFEMFRIDLAIDQLYPLRLQLLNIADKSVFARIADLAEHALAKKHPAHPDAVQSSNQFSVLPRFRAVRITGLMQPDISLPDFIGDPGAFLPPPCHCLALTDHLPEISIDAEIECLPPDQLSHALTDLEFIRE